jgi:hypothetical protein
MEGAVMEDYQTIVHDNRMREIKGHAIAFLMLGISLFALYTHALYLAIIPLLWMAFRVGKERGREQAQHDIEQTTALAQMLKFPDLDAKPPVPRPPSPSSNLRQFPQH